MKSTGNPSVDISLKSNDILRRYLDVPRFVSFLKMPSLYLCRSDLFPDKFEGSFTTTVKDEICNVFAKYGANYSYDRLKKDLRERVFINCWSRGIDDNMALWKLYGKSNDCVALTTTVGQLTEMLNGFKGHGELSLRKVKYIKHWKNPEIKVKPLSNVFRYKAIGYSFENEVRVILDRFDHNSDSKEEGVILPVIPKSFLRSVVVSPECSPWFKSVIEDIMEKYNISCPVRISSMSKEPI